MIDEATRANWPAGPWNEEPDRLQWVDPASDLDCLIVRGPVGALCGYVGVPNGHPWYGSALEDLEELGAPGGITYAAPCQADGPICHVPEHGRPDDVWWIGFDCAHAGDLVPAMMAMHASLRPVRPPYGIDADTYKDIGYVRREVAALALQLSQPTQADGECRSDSQRGPGRDDRVAGEGVSRIMDNHMLTAKKLAERAVRENWPVVASATMAVAERICMSYADGGRARVYSIPVYHAQLCETHWHEIPAALHALIDPEQVG